VFPSETQYTITTMKKIVIAVGCALLLAIYSAAAESGQQLADLSGRWKNINRNASGISKMEIQTTNSPVTIEMFGACSPNGCDWGVSQGLAYGPNVSSNLAQSGNCLRPSMILDLRKSE
jgi:hypothetical protein